MTSIGTTNVTNCRHSSGIPQVMPMHCAYTRTLDIQWAEFMTRDLVPIRVNITGGTHRSIRDFHEKTSAPPMEVQKLVEYCNGHGLPLLLVSDANAQSVSWGSKYTNKTAL